MSANAGSGKTHVLSQRVIRLLLKRHRPVENPVPDLYAGRRRQHGQPRLSRTWPTGRCSTTQAGRADRKARRRRPGADKLRRARRLFAEALETPGGLKIQTIHAFCEAILHQFPLEANIAGHFEMLDQQMEQSLLAEARRAMITGSGGGGQPELAAAFAKILERAGESGLDNLLREIVGKRDELSGLHRPAAWWRRLPSCCFGNSASAEGETADIDRCGRVAAAGIRPASFAAFANVARAAGAKTIVENILPAATGGFAEADPLQRLALLVAGFLDQG